MKVRFVTLTDSVIDCQMCSRSVDVDETMTIGSFKKYVQKLHSLDEHGSSFNYVNGIHPNFQHPHIRGKKLIFDEKSLREYDINNNLIIFGVSHGVGKKLRDGMKTIYNEYHSSKCPEGFERVGDDKILHKVLADLHRGYEAGDEFQSDVERLIFNANQINFREMEGIKCGGISYDKQYPKWFVFHVGELQLQIQTMNGIPIKFHRWPDIQEQVFPSMSSAGANKEAAQGYIRNDGIMMHCQSHFTGAAGVHFGSSTSHIHQVHRIGGRYNEIEEYRIGGDDDEEGTQQQQVQDDGDGAGEQAAAAVLPPPPPLPDLNLPTAGWASATDSNGRVYYYDLATGNSQWERPQTRG